VLFVARGQSDCGVPECVLMPRRRPLTVGAAIGGWLFDLFGDSRLTGLNIESVYSVGAAAIGAVIALVVYITFSSVAACCEALGEPVSVLECMPRNWPDFSTRW
jgi:hypothetical protein